MINNGKDIRKAMRDAKKEPSKGDPLKGVIYDPRGQYAFPGEITKIQGDAYGTPITMVGVPYPMLGVDDLGNSQMMYPNMEYQFAGQHVTEYPMPPKQYFNAYGGDPSLPAITGHYPFGGMYTKTHTHMQEGGWLDQYQPGGRIPIYVSDKNDPRYKAYQDSTNLYKQTQSFRKDLGPEIGREPYSNTYDEIIEISPGVFKTVTRKDTQKIKPLYYAKYSTIPTQGSRAIVDNRIVDTFGTGSYGMYPVFKKPVQPVIYSEEKINPEYLPMIQASMPEMISREPEIIMPSAPKPSNTNNRIAWRMDPDTRKMVPVYLEGKTQKVKEGKRLYNKNIPSSTAAIPADFVPQFEPDSNADVVSKQMGGWLDNMDDEYRKGGGVNPLMKARSKRSGTSKNIQSSINKIFLRNKDLFGPGGKNVYDPNSKYQVGGLRAASTTAAVPVSTKAPVNPVNPESTMGLIDFIKHKWNTRDQGPSDWDLGFIDPVTGNYVNTNVTPFDVILPVQAVSGAKTAASALANISPKKVINAAPSTAKNLTNFVKESPIVKNKATAFIKEAIKQAKKAYKWSKENIQDIKNLPEEYKTAIQDLTSKEGLKRLKDMGIEDTDDFIRYLNNVKLKATMEGSHFFPVGPGVLSINPAQIKKLRETIMPLGSQKSAIDHELGHAIQHYLEYKDKTFNRLTDLDIEAAESLAPHMTEGVSDFFKNTRGMDYESAKNIAKNLGESSANYLFRNKREPLAHLRETKRAMVNKGVISNIHEIITPEHIQEFILKGGDKDRILSFLQQKPEARQTLTNLLNKTPALIPIGLGVGAAFNQEKNGGWLDNLD